MGNRMQQSSGKSKVMYQNQEVEEADEEEETDNKAMEAEPSEQEPAEGIVELTEEQLVELLQNADKLSPEQ